MQRHLQCVPIKLEAASFSTAEKGLGGGLHTLACKIPGDLEVELEEGARKGWDATQCTL